MYCSVFILQFLIQPQNHLMTPLFYELFLECQTPCILDPPLQLGIERGRLGRQNGKALMIKKYC